jgi:hypothetical protein
MLAADVLISPNANALGASLSGLSPSPPLSLPLSGRYPLSLSLSRLSSPPSLSGRYLISPSLSGLSPPLSLWSLPPLPLPSPSPSPPLSRTLCW